MGHHCDVFPIETSWPFPHLSFESVLCEIIPQKKTPGQMQPTLENSEIRSWNLNKSIYKWLFQLDNSESIHENSGCFAKHPSIRTWLFQVPGCSKRCNFLTFWKTNCLWPRASELDRGLIIQMEVTYIIHP